MAEAGGRLEAFPQRRRAPRQHRPEPLAHQPQRLAEPAVRGQGLVDEVAVEGVGQHHAFLRIQRLAARRDRRAGREGEPAAVGDPVERPAARRSGGGSPQSAMAALPCCDIRRSCAPVDRIDAVDIGAAPLVPMPRFQRRARWRARAPRSARPRWPAQRVGQLGGDAEGAGELGVQRRRLALAADAGPVHEVPVGQVGDQARRARSAARTRPAPSGSRGRSPRSSRGRRCSASGRRRPGSIAASSRGSTGRRSCGRPARTSGSGRPAAGFRPPGPGTWRSAARRTARTRPSRPGSPPSRRPATAAARGSGSPPRRRACTAAGCRRRWPRVGRATGRTR